MEFRPLYSKLSVGDDPILNRPGVYAILNTQNGMVYIGQSVFVRDRLQVHRQELLRGKHLNKALQSDFGKFGKDNFNCLALEYCYVHETRIKETFWVEMAGQSRVYNISGCIAYPAHLPEKMFNASLINELFGSKDYPYVIRIDRNLVKRVRNPDQTITLQPIQKDMGANMADIQTYKTVREWATMYDKDVQTVMAQLRRKGIKGMSLDSPMSADDWAKVYGKHGKTLPAKPAKQSVLQSTPAVRNVVPSEIKPEPIKKEQGRGRKWILYSLMFIPAAASLQNMHGVTHDITGHWIAAILLTGLFSASPFLFVLAGVKNAPTGILVACMVIYEAFCNLTRIYGGLTGFGKGGFPTRFLGLVTDVFNTGTHQTGVFLAAVMAILAACTFYAAYFELNKNG